METIGRYRILSTLGQGGMGIVYEAHDDRLDRTVAIKLMRDAVMGVGTVERFWREARAAASINHPHVCQIFEVGEEAGRPFIVMERLTGETLASRLLRGPLPAREAARQALGLLDALEALHQRSVIHRDLKPSNVFLVSHGVKLLDFGLARDVSSLVDTASTRLTTPGVLIGTPQYMAPEQVSGAALDARADLFAAGVILFEMLRGKPAFAGATPIAVLEKVLHEHPPALVGSPFIAALDAVIHRAVAKNPEQRYQSAAAMASDVRHTLALDDSGEVVRVMSMTRIVVLPFRLLRPDPDTEFLAYGLPDAITASLSAHEGISIRSPLAASKFASDAPDLRAIAEQLDVDHVLTGTLLRSQDQLRVSVQLIEAPNGRVAWSHGAQATLGDLFQLQDTLTHGIVNALPVGSRAARQIDVPNTSRAYELYLRANQLALESGTYRVALSLYERCIEDDPHFAPAWARLGRTRRVIGKYLETDADPMYAGAEEAFKRALTLNPDLPIAHSLYSYLEVEVGRADDAMAHLLKLIAQQPTDPDLLAALCHVLRYCGLLTASVAADERAKRFDPQMRTSVPHTYFMRGEYERTLGQLPWLTDPLYAITLMTLGRREEALAAIKVDEERFANSIFERRFVAHLRGAAERNLPATLAAIDEFLGGGFRDGEGVYYCVRSLAYLGETSRAIEALRRALDLGFFCYPAFERDAWLDSLRGLGPFKELMQAARARHSGTARIFADLGGERLLGMRSSTQTLG
jgi:serine/threonine protein kinase